MVLHIKRSSKITQARRLWYENQAQDLHDPMHTKPRLYSVCTASAMPWNVCGCPFQVFRWAALQQIWDHASHAVESLLVSPQNHVSVREMTNLHTYSPPHQHLPVWTFTWTSRLPSAMRWKGLCTLRHAAIVNTGWITYGSIMIKNENKHREKLFQGPYSYTNWSAPDKNGKKALTRADNNGKKAHLSRKSFSTAERLPVISSFLWPSAKLKEQLPPSQQAIEDMALRRKKSENVAVTLSASFCHLCSGCVTLAGSARCAPCAHQICIVQRWILLATWPAGQATIRNCVAQHEGMLSKSIFSVFLGRKEENSSRVVCLFWFAIWASSLSFSSRRAAKIWIAMASGDAVAFNSVEAVDVFNFDFQQNLPTPKLTVGDQFYKRLMWTYLFGVYNVGAQRGYAFMWDEVTAHRGSADVISCLDCLVRKTAARSGAKKAIFWSDNCPGQNKNNAIMWWYQHLVDTGVYTRIDAKFLVVGHTYGRADQLFGRLEKEYRKHGHVEVPADWVQVVKMACSGPLSQIETIVMQQSDFRNWPAYLGQRYGSRTRDVDGRALDFKNAMCFAFDAAEHPNVARVWHSHDSEGPYKVVDFRKRHVDMALPSEVPPLYHQYPLPLKPAKVKDLVDLAAKYVSVTNQQFYFSLAEVVEDDTNHEDYDVWRWD